MITGFFLTVGFSFLTFLIALLPTGGTFPQEWVTGIHTLWGYVNMFSFFFPVGTMVTALGIAMSFHLFVFGWKGMHWVLSMLRGSKLH